MPTDILLFMGLLLTVSILLSPLSSRIGMPILLLFLAIGMVAGEDGLGGLQFDNFEVAFVVGNLALAIILLDGGMRTRAETFRVGLRPALVLASVGVALTAVLTGLAAMWIFDLPLLVGLLVGTIVSSTDAAAVFALLQGRGLRLNERVSATLEIESGSNDPMAIFLTLVLLALITEGQASATWETATLLLQQFGLGALGGWLGGLSLVAVLNRVALMPALYPLLVMAGGLVIFGGVNTLGGSGFLAIYLAGVVLSHRRVRMLPAILQTHDGLAWLAQMGLFLILGLLVTPSQLLEVIVGGLAVAAVLILVARPMAIALSLWPFGFKWREQAFISWVGLRGAVPIVLALFPIMAGIEEAHLLFNVAFCVVLVSLLVQGTTLAPVARWLRLEVPASREPLRRVPVDLPAVGDHELLLFALEGPRWETPQPLRSLKMPRAAAVAAVFRQGELLPPRPDQTVRNGDLVAVMSSYRHLETLGKIFEGKRRPRRLEEREFFGEFVLNGEATIGDVELFYGIDISGYEPAQSLATCFAQIQHGHPVVGDKIRVGPVTLVVKAVEGDLVTKVGLKLHKDR